MVKKVFLAGDHAAVELKDNLVKLLTKLKIEAIDLGTNDAKSVDYPDYADKLAKELKKDTQAKGILLCGTGIGISIAANRHKHIRAALCHSLEEAKLTREHNDANVLCLGARFISTSLAQGMVQVFMKTPFAGGRHSQRVKKLC